MIITITSLRLKTIWNFFGLANYALSIVKQMKNEKGLIKFKKRGAGFTHYTLSAWESEEDLKRFARTGAHLEAMKQSAKIASEIWTYTYKAGHIPDWKEAKKLLMEKGKSIKFK